MAAHHDYRKLLENKNVDAVIIATNAQWHVLPTIAACQAGKDVYPEKPAEGNPETRDSILNHRFPRPGNR